MTDDDEHETLRELKEILTTIDKCRTGGLKQEVDFEIL